MRSLHEMIIFADTAFRLCYAFVSGLNLTVLY